jgi:carbon starvation protein CstA
MRKTYAIRSAILSLIVNAAFVWMVNDALAVDTWTCTTYGNTTTCSGWQGGRWVSCTTNCYGNSCTTNCY